MTTVEVERPSERIAVVRLNRPEQLNALNYTLVGALYDALDDIAADDRCRVVILTGAGRAFCAGLDLRAITAGRPRWVRTAAATRASARKVFSRTSPNASTTCRRRSSPQSTAPRSVAGSRSRARAISASASASATFCSAFIRTGMTGTDVGITYFLPRLIGAARAFDMILTGRTIDAAEAERMGLVSRVWADDELGDAARDLAEGIAGFTAFGLRRTKEVLWHNLEAPSVAAAIALENRNQELAVHEPEVLEYMQTYAARFKS